MKHESYILLSDCNTHDACAVHIMQKTIMPEIKKLCPKVKKIIYFTDDAKQHYKNRFTMMNLLSHKTDFGVEAEWYFHVTAHGKGACDGAILKREAIRASLHRKQNLMKQFYHQRLSLTGQKVNLKIH